MPYRLHLARDGVETLSDPMMRRRQLRRELAQLRVTAGLSMREVARAVGWTESKVSRIEGGQRGARVTDVVALLGLYGVTDEPTRDMLTEMARRAHERAWWQSYGRNMIPSEYGAVIGLESEAVEIATYQPELVPGLLQTRAYARAVIEAARPDDTPEQITERVSVRLARQRILTRVDPPPPKLRVILNEAVLRRKVGGDEVMRGQLRHLIDGPAEVCVLPFSAGAHPAMASGPFEIYDFHGAAELSVVSGEGITGTLTLESREDLERHVDVFEQLSAAALDTQRSRAILISLVDG